MTRHDALVAILAVTEETHAQTTHADADAHTLTALAERRAELLRHCLDDGPLSEAERAVILRLRDLDALLLHWGSALQHDLERERATLIHREPAGPDARVLLDIA